MLTSKELINYINNFYGYGNLKSKIWFIGIEEGGGNSEKEIENRLNNWKKIGNCVINIKTHHEIIGYGDFFSEGIYQNTWWKLIRLLISYQKGEKVSKEYIRNFQKHNWGQETSENALLELYPLPSVNNHVWKISKWSTLSFLKTRKNYYHYCNENAKRHEFIKIKIKKFKPELVIFYSKGMINHWNEIIGIDINVDGIEKKIGKHHIYYILKDKVLYIVTPHPSHARSNSFWEDLGKEIYKIKG